MRSVLFIFTKFTTQSLCSVRIVKRGYLLLPIFRSPYKKREKKLKKVWKKENKKICSSEKRCRSAKKKAKNWLKRFKNAKIEI